MLIYSCTRYADNKMLGKREPFASEYTVTDKQKQLFKNFYISRIPSQKCSILFYDAIRVKEQYVLHCLS